MRFLACRKIRSTKFRTRLLIEQHARAAESSTHFFVSWKSCLGVSQQAKFLQFWRRPRCRAVLDSRQQRWKRFDAGWTNARFAGGSTRNIVCDSVCRLRGKQLAARSRSDVAGVGAAAAKSPVARRN